MILFTGCSKQNEPEQTTTWYDAFSELSTVPLSYGVWLETEGITDIKKASKINVIWHNDSNQELVFGKPFTLAYKKNDIWKEVELVKREVEFEAIGIILGANSEVLQSYNLSMFDSTFEKGEYKFISSIFIDGINYSIDVEFKVN